MFFASTNIALAAQINCKSIQGDDGGDFSDGYELTIPLEAGLNLGGKAPALSDLQRKNLAIEFHNCIKNKKGSSSFEARKEVFEFVARSCSKATYAKAIANELYYGFTEKPESYDGYKGGSTIQVIEPIFASGCDKDSFAGLEDGFVSNISLEHNTTGCEASNSDCKTTNTITLKLISINWLSDVVGDL